MRNDSQTYKDFSDFAEKIKETNRLVELWRKMLNSKGSLFPTEIEFLSKIITIALKDFR